MVKRGDHRSVAAIIIGRVKSSIYARQKEKVGAGNGRFYDRRTKISLDSFFFFFFFLILVEMNLIVAVRKTLRIKGKG